MFLARIPLFPGLTTEQMLLKDMKVASEGDLRLAVSVIYMTLEVGVHLNYSICDTTQGYTYYWWIITWFKFCHVPSSTAVYHLTMHVSPMNSLQNLIFRSKLNTVLKLSEPFPMLLPDTPFRHFPVVTA
jgi:hypothetical protein